MISSKKLKVSMDNYLVKWNTARLITLELGKLKFFYGYKAINPELHEIYMYLKDYAKNYNDITVYRHNNFGYDKEGYSSWIEYLDKMLEFQLFVISKEDNNEAGEIASRAKNLFGNKDVADAYCADLHILNQLNLLLEYSESVRNLFNYIVPLTKDLDGILIETEQELRQILDAKGLGDFQVPKELIITQNN